MSIAKYEAFIKTVEEGSLTKAAESPVSYTHLDVYKRQQWKY